MPTLLDQRFTRLHPCLIWFTDQDFVGPFVQRMVRGSRKAHDAGGFRKCERIAGMGRPAHCGKGAQKGSSGRVG